MLEAIWAQQLHSNRGLRIKEMLHGGAVLKDTNMGKGYKGVRDMNSQAEISSHFSQDFNSKQFNSHVQSQKLKSTSGVKRNRNTNAESGRPLLNPNTASRKTQKVVEQLSQAQQKDSGNMASKDEKDLIGSALLQLKSGRK